MPEGGRIVVEERERRARRKAEVRQQLADGQVIAQEVNFCILQTKDKIIFVAGE